MEKYVVYVKTNDAGYIMSVASSGFLRDTEGWTEIDRGSGQRYYHAQVHYLPQHIRTESGAWQYKLVDGSPVECTEEEIAAQEALIPQPEQPQDYNLNVYDELEAAYQEGVNSI